MGYTSSADQRMLPAIKFIGLTDASGNPTDLWKELRSSFGTAIAKGLLQGYAELFYQYPDAHKKDDEAIRNFFLEHTELGSAAVSKVVNTFKALCEIAEFDGAETHSPRTSAGESSPPPVKRKSGRKENQYAQIGTTVGGMTVNINVQLQVPPDATGEIYDKFFEAMKKHLFTID